MLDVYIADSFETAARSDSDFGIDFDLHRALFHGGAKVTSSCPTLNRIQDYYADCTIAGADIALLQEEVEALLTTLATNSPFRPMLVRLQ